ncbi:MAG: S-methyl-5-thioribose-1-phosphate isomerase [Candidatus Omnitrophota bacterium]
MIETIRWKSGKLKLIDQTKLPKILKYIICRNKSDVWKAIHTMQVRGAPAIGVVAGFGLAFGTEQIKTKNVNLFYKEFDKIIYYLKTSRPTAKNLSWALERIKNKVIDMGYNNVASIKKAAFDEAIAIYKEDVILCRKLGQLGQKLIKNNVTIMTICNAGALAAVDFGTALSLIYEAKNKGKNLEVYALETRPFLQGARLTSWELKKSGIDVTLISDNMAATVLKTKKVDLIIAGADRIARNGDTANKIGTYGLAILAKFHKVPFYIVAPFSTFDLKLKDGRQIPIEERKAKELTHDFFKQPIAPKGIKVYNPAFDVTDNGLITAIVTERGIIYPPFKENIAKILEK